MCAKNDDIEGWKEPERNIKYIDGFGNLIDDTVPLAEEEEEDVPYIPDNVEMVSPGLFFISETLINHSTL